MYNIQWDEVFKTCVQSIDDEHRKMIYIVNRMRKACLEKSYLECHQIANKLVRYSKDHFKHEEDYLESVSFPRLTGHKKYHEKLLQEVDTIRKTCSDLPEEHSIEDCLDQMEQLIIDDILVGDVDFMSFLEFNGYATRKILI